MKTKQGKEVIYPGNRRFKEKLAPGDRQKIAKKAGMSVATVRDMFNGYRRLNDKVKAAIVELFEEKQRLEQALEDIINQ